MDVETSPPQRLLKTFEPVFSSPEIMQNPTLQYFVPLRLDEAHKFPSNLQAVLNYARDGTAASEISDAHLLQHRVSRPWPAQQAS